MTQICNVSLLHGDAGELACLVSSQCPKVANNFQPWEMETSVRGRMGSEPGDEDVPGKLKRLWVVQHKPAQPVVLMLDPSFIC